MRGGSRPLNVDQLATGTMTEDGPEGSPEPAAAILRADTLADSVLILLVMTIVQRLVGLMRGMLFCRWLEPEQLGQWDVAFGFLTLAAPLAVFGLPGSFGRYAEYYRQRGQLRTFLRRTTMTSVLLVLIAIGLIVAGRNWFSSLIFGAPDQGPLVGWVAVSMAALVMNNFLVSLFLSVRLYRVVTGLQFFQSLLFALVSVALLATWRTDATTIVMAFGLSCLLGCGGSLRWLRQIWHDASDQQPPIAQTTFWSKLVPFAIWMWVTNLISNLFEVMDRYMIVHHAGLDAVDAMREVGYYHSSRIIPLLLVGVAMLLGAIITPHLSHDWEAGRRGAVSARLNLVLKSLACAFLGGSVAVLVVAPYLFEIAFHSKFAGGLAVLPWTLTYCIWSGMNGVAQNYLWCAEKARLGCLALLVGLCISVGLNLVLLPRFGLHGAVWSTSAANFVALGMVYGMNYWSGMRIDRGTLLVSLLPLALVMGPLVGSVALAVVSVIAVATNFIFNRDEKQQLLGAAQGYLSKLERFRWRFLKLRFR